MSLVIKEATTTDYCDCQCDHFPLGIADNEDSHPFNMLEQHFHTDLTRTIPGSYTDADDCPHQSVKNDRSNDRHTIDQMDLGSTEFDTLNNCNTDMTRGDGNSHDPRPLQKRGGTL